MKKKYLLCLCMIHFYFFNNGFSLLSLSPPHSFENTLHPYSLHPPDDQTPSDTSIPNNHVENSVPQNLVAQNLIAQGIDPNSPVGRIILETQTLIAQGIDPNSPVGRSILDSRLSGIERTEQSMSNPFKWYDRLGDVQNTKEFLTSPRHNKKWWSTITISIRTYLFIFRNDILLSLLYSLSLASSFFIILLAFLYNNFALRFIISISILVCLSMINISTIYYCGFKKIYLDITFLKTVPLIIKDYLFICFFCFFPFLLIHFSIPYSLLIPICILAFLAYSLCFFYKEYQHNKLNNKKINFVKSFLKIPLDFIVMILVSIFFLIIGLIILWSVLTRIVLIKKALNS